MSTEERRTVCQNMLEYTKAKREKKNFCAKKSRKRKENGVLIKILILNMILK